MRTKSPKRNLCEYQLFQYRGSLRERLWILKFSQFQGKQITGLVSSSNLHFFIIYTETYLVGMNYNRDRHIPVALIFNICMLKFKLHQDNRRNALISQPIVCMLDADFDNVNFYLVRHLS